MIYLKQINVYNIHLLHKLNNFFLFYDLKYLKGKGRKIKVYHKINSHELIKKTVNENYNNRYLCVSLFRVF